MDDDRIAKSYLKRFEGESEGRLSFSQWVVGGRGKCGACKFHGCRPGFVEGVCKIRSVAKWPERWFDDWCGEWKESVLWPMLETHLRDEKMRAKWEKEQG